MYRLSVQLVLAALATHVASVDTVSPASLDISQTCKLKDEISWLTPRFRMPYADVSCYSLDLGCRKDACRRCHVLLSWHCCGKHFPDLSEMENIVLGGKDRGIGKVGKGVGFLGTAQ